MATKLASVWMARSRKCFTKSRGLGGYISYRDQRTTSRTRINLQKLFRFMGETDLLAYDSLDSPLRSEISEIAVLVTSSFASAERMVTDLSLTETTVPMMPLAVVTLSPARTALSNSACWRCLFW